MKLLLLAKTEGDNSLIRFSEELRIKKIPFVIKSYTKLSLNYSEGISNLYNIIPEGITHAIFRPSIKYSFLRHALIDYSLRKDIKVLNGRSFSTVVGYYNKLDQFIKFSEAGFDIPATYTFSELRKLKEFIQKNKDITLIQKPIYNSNARGIRLYNQDSELQTAELSSVLFQEKIEHDFQYRLVVLNSEVVVAIKKRKEVHKLVSNSGKGELALDLPSNILNETIKAAELLNLEYAGADWIKDTNTGKFYLLEVNRMPAFRQTEEVSNTNIASKIIEYLISS